MRLSWLLLVDKQILTDIGCVLLLRALKQAQALVSLLRPEDTVSTSETISPVALAPNSGTE